jgi:hypothetical protein
MISAPGIESSCWKKENINESEINTEFCAEVNLYETALHL